MSMEFKVRKWLWIVLIVVVVLGGGFTFWYIYGNKSTIIPTPEQSAMPSGLPINSVSPSTPGSTGPPVMPDSNGEITTSEKTEAPEQNSTGQVSAPTIATKSWEGKLAASGYTDLICVPNIYFEYPKDLPLLESSTPTMGGGKYLSLGDGTLSISALSYTNAAQYQPIYCLNPPYDSVNACYDQYKNNHPYNQFNDPEQLTINGYPALRWNESYDIYSTTKTIIQNNDKNIISVSLRNTDNEVNSSAYNIILNSFKYK